MVSASGLSLAEVFVERRGFPSSNCRHAMRAKSFFASLGD